MTHLRRCAALIAAYAVALQLVLPAFAGAALLAPAFGMSFEICRGGSADGSAAPATHEPCGACVVHCAGTAMPPDRSVAAISWPTDREPIATSSPQRRLITAANAREHSPRAPPVG